MSYKKTGKNSKIGLIVTHMEPGGAQRAAIRLAEHFIEKGIECRVYFLFKRHSVYQEKNYTEVICESRPDSLRGLWCMQKKLVLNLKEFQPKHIVTFTHYAACFGNLAAWWLGITGRWASHRNPFYSFPFPAKVGIQILSLLKIIKGHISVSDFVRNTLPKWIKRRSENIFVVRNGIDFVTSDLSKKDAREKFNIDVDVPLLISVGRLAPQKNQKLLIRVLEKEPDFQLWIAGEGELRGELEQEIYSKSLQEQVELIGNIPPGEVGNFLRAGDIFVMPSKFEGFSNVVLEAASSGLPIICSDIPALREAFDRVDESVLYADSEDSDQWVKLIRNIHKKPTHKKQLGQKAQKVARKFTVEAMGQKFLSILNSNEDD